MDQSDNEKLTYPQSGKTLRQGSDSYRSLSSGVVALVESARGSAARRVNALMTATYWEIGRRIVEFEQKGQSRAAYGQSLVKRLGLDLTRKFGRGFSSRNLAQMKVFFLSKPPDQILQTPSAESSSARTLQASSGTPWSSARVTTDLEALSGAFPLPWSVYVTLMAVKEEPARRFYEAEALRGGWSVRQLSRQIDSQYYERMALSRDKAAMLRHAGAAVSTDVPQTDSAFKDPFVLEFLNLKDEYSESDLEEALIHHLADFLLELGDDFAFVSRQRRLRIDDRWFRVDLLFFHRRLRCLLVVDLKVGKFSYTDAGQMHLYLNYAREHWVKVGENPPVGLILCATKGEAEARYSLENLTNTVLAAEYRTVLPDADLIAAELAKTRSALEDSRRRR